MVDFTKADISEAATNGITYLNLYNRVENLGWDLEQAKTEPIVQVNFAWRDNKEAAEANGVTRYLFTRALNEGYSLDEAIAGVKRKKGKRIVSIETINLAASNGIKYRTLMKRLRNYGFSEHDSATAGLYEIKKLKSKNKPKTKDNREHIKKWAKQQSDINGWNVRMYE